MDLVADQDQLLHTQDLGEYMQSLLFDFSCRAIKFLAAVFTLRHFDNRLFFFGVLVIAGLVQLGSMSICGSN